MSATTPTPGKRAGRTGGRAARVAARTAGLSDDEKAVHPGQSGGAFKPLTDSECRTVYETALTMLEEFGMGTPIPEFIEVVVPYRDGGASGAEVDAVAADHDGAVVVKTVPGELLGCYVHGVLDEGPGEVEALVGV